MATTTVSTTSVATARATAVQQSTATAVAAKASAPTPKAANGQPTSDQLKAALLTLSDMPTGWTTSDSNGSDKSSTSICGVASTPTPSNETSASVDFQKSQLGPFLTEQIDALPAGQMKAVFKILKESLSCTKWTETDSQGTPTTYQISPLSFPKLGDDTFAFRMTGGSGILTFEADAVYIRVGDYAITIANVAVGSVDSDLTASIAQKAVDKVHSFGN